MSTDRAEEAPHVIRLHDLRKRVDHAIQYRAECSCGWMGYSHYGTNAEGLARRDGTVHTDRVRARRIPGQDR